MRKTEQRNHAVAVLRGRVAETRLREGSHTHLREQRCGRKAATRPGMQVLHLEHEDALKENGH